MAYACNMPGKHGYGYGYGKPQERDPRAVRAVRPGTVNSLDIEEWNRRMLASEHLPIESTRPPAGRQRSRKEGMAG